MYLSIRLYDIVQLVSSVKIDPCRQAARFSVLTWGCPCGVTECWTSWACMHSNLHTNCTHCRLSFLTCKWHEGCGAMLAALSILRTSINWDNYNSCDKLNILYSLWSWRIVMQFAKCKRSMHGAFAWLHRSTNGLNSVCNQFVHVGAMCSLLAIFVHDAT